MHFEILVEGQSDLTALSSGIISDILGDYGAPHTWKIHKHQGVGCINPNPNSPPNIKDRTLLHNLPSKLRAYGKALKKDEVVIVLIDLDDKDEDIRQAELEDNLNYCDPKPTTLFSLAIEEMEAWFLGDVEALLIAYPDARLEAMTKYDQDSQCGTWEVLAEVIHAGGIRALLSKGKRSVEILEQKRVWANKICPHMKKERNTSPSYQRFRDQVLALSMLV
ncbi:DUF4276 family protein [Pseudomonas sp.]|uniref:DUF4276 family protein n=1 Tax=Pseudomonas sp. TaxID=306 RepID=UPI00326631C7